MVARLLMLAPASADYNSTGIEPAHTETRRGLLQTRAMVGRFTPESARRCAGHGPLFPPLLRSHVDCSRRLQPRRLLLGLFFVIQSGLAHNTNSALDSIAEKLLQWWNQTTDNQTHAFQPPTAA
jgi:hypothetical protein